MIIILGRDAGDCVRATAWNYKGMFSPRNTLPTTKNYQWGVNGGWARLWRVDDPFASPQEKKPWVCVKQPSEQRPRLLRTAGDSNATCSTGPLHQAHRNKYKCFDLRHWYQMKVRHLLLLRLGEKPSWHREKRWGKKGEFKQIWWHGGHADRKRLGYKCSSDTQDTYNSFLFSQWPFKAIECLSFQSLPIY